MGHVAALLGAFRHPAHPAVSHSFFPKSLDPMGLLPVRGVGVTHKEGFWGWGHPNSGVQWRQHTLEHVITQEGLDEVSYPTSHLECSERPLAQSLHPWFWGCKIYEASS